MINDQTTMEMKSYQSKNVCVIGAGPSGLVAARELRKEGHRVVVLEQNHDVGGQWLYVPNVEGEDPLGKNTTLKVHSSVYNSLRINSVRETMGFTDFPFLVKKGRDTRRFPGHRELLLYLQDFCDFFALREMIRFNTRVENVKSLNYSNQLCENLSWVVKSFDSKNLKVVEEVFDAVVVATGHFSHLRLPPIKGLLISPLNITNEAIEPASTHVDGWTQKHLHSHVYRVPEPFQNEVVVVVGTANSGQDITMELVKMAKEVHLSARSVDICEGLSKVISKHDNLHLHPEIDSLHEDGRVVFVDGTCIAADTIIYCTGYTCSYPFLDIGGIVVVDDGRVGPLYEHTFPPLLAPSLSFVGIPRKVIGFPFFESQAKWIAQLLSGKKRLPSCADMMQSVKEFYESKDLAGVPKRNTHDIGDFEYCDKYADLVGVPHLEEWRKELCMAAIKKSEVDLETYREYSYEQELLQLPHQYLTPSN